MKNEMLSDPHFSERKRFIYKQGIVYYEVDRPYEFFYAGLDLNEYRQVTIKGLPEECQILVQLNTNKLISNALNADDYDLSHWRLIQSEGLGENSFVHRPYSYNTDNDYLIVHGEDSDLYTPFPLEYIIDQDGNDCISISDINNVESLSVLDNEEWPYIFMSEEQIQKNIETINSIVDNCCNILKKKGYLVNNINDLISLYLDNVI
jgi:hypothetical protein